jgi:4-hydroxybenzoate polyprenyltransferase
MTTEAVVKAPPLPVALFRALRPGQWVKNLVVFAGILFTLDEGHNAADWLRVGGAFLVFCALASAIYLVNDLCDLEQDRQHPRKKLRPLPAGHVPLGLARFTAAILGAAGLAGALLLGNPFALTAALYLSLTVAYSLWLKHVALIDVMVLAGFYVVRAAAGAVVIHVGISPWLLLCTFLGALLLGLAKRRNELLVLDEAADHRRSLEEYSVPMLDQMLVIITACTLTAYMLYTFTSDTAREHPMMMLTIPFAVYGILRFFYLVHRHEKGGDPSADLVQDRSLLACGILWAAACAAILLLGG